MTESPFRAKPDSAPFNGATRLPAKRDEELSHPTAEALPLERTEATQTPAPAPVHHSAPAEATRETTGLRSDYPDFLDQFADWDAPDEHEAGALQAGAPVTPQLLRPRPLEPTSGPRRWVHAMTGGLINLGPSAAQLREQERMARIQRPLRGAHVTTYLCLKGGITKTTTCIGTALTAAQYRPEAVVAGDFNPDAGDLAERVTGREGLAGVNQLAQHVDSVTSIGDLSRYLYSEGRLTVLPGEPDPKLGESLTSAQFNAVIEILSSYYSSIHVDAGTGITHPIMPGILARTDTLVVPAAYSITGAKRAYETLAWLRSNGFGRLASSAIVALTERDLVSREVDKNAVLAMFEGIPVVKVPADRHLADGAQVQLEQMQPRTREAFAEIAALIADRYPA